MIDYYHRCILTSIFATQSQNTNIQTHFLNDIRTCADNLLSTIYMNVWSLTNFNRFPKPLTRVIGAVTWYSLVLKCERGFKDQVLSETMPDQKKSNNMHQ